MPLNPVLKRHEKAKIILLGSGGLSIGQAGEFDYSGTQAVQSLSAEGFEMIVINPNVATVQTNPEPGKKVYLYPVEPQWVEKVIEKEKPQAIVAGFGGQTALNCLIALEQKGVLKKHGVVNLGTSVESLLLSEDRQKFADRMRELSVPIPPSRSAETVDDAVAAAGEIGYPVIVRAAFTLGGLGGGFAANAIEMRTLAQAALAVSPQVLVEKSLKGWREVEYEIMRDSAGNTICICNMENFDPLGIHTGDSIVVAPSQTLTDHEYQELRNTAFKIVQSLKVIGECNVQFALSPNSSELYVIEINARLSRSSALASKATGYPIAFIAAKVVAGYNLTELKNPVTEATSALYEPALDYLAVKMPRWDLGKFSGVSRQLGSTMKSVGEVMALGRSFPEALQKAVRMVSENPVGLSAAKNFTDDEITTELKFATDRRLFAIAEAFRRGRTLEQVHDLTHIDRWFLRHVEVVIEIEKEIGAKPIFEEDVSPELWRRAKRWGFGDEQIAHLMLRAQGGDGKAPKASEVQRAGLELRRRRLAFGVRPVVKKIDTTAGEFPSSSNYLYLTYWGDENDALTPDNCKQSAIILGSGSYSIGTSVEFDWCAVSCSRRLIADGWRSVMLNCNPETVSTDYSSSNRLYFEELTLERVLDIQALEEATGVVASMGGQLPNRLAMAISDAGLRLLGHDAETVRQAENRREFSHALDELGIGQPRWVEAKSWVEIEAFVEKTGFPVLVRPSFVLSGSAMNVAYDHESLRHFVQVAEHFSGEHPIVISEYLQGAREYEFDGVAQDGEIVKSIASEHIENAGVHSGDATLMVPSPHLSAATLAQLESIGAQIAKRLRLNGPFNIQTLVHQGRALVIECNARASRSFPFVSKVLGVNLADIATDAFLKKARVGAYPATKSGRFGVKSAVFSFSRLQGADPVMGVEMVSTGEVGAIANNSHEALLLSLQASSIRRPRKGILISSGREAQKEQFLEVMPFLQKLGIPLFATAGTADFLKARGFQVTRLAWPGESGPSCLDAIRERQVDMVINMPKNLRAPELSFGRQVRQLSVVFGCSLFTNMEKAIAYFKALEAAKKDAEKNHIPMSL